MGIFKKEPKFNNLKNVEGKPILDQKALFLGQGKIKFGKNVHLGYFPSPLFYSTYCHIEARNKTSEIFIDDDTYINNNCAFISNGAKIRIGKNCRIGVNFQCFDSDFHPINPEDRINNKEAKNKDVTIKDNVFIGNNVIILKGVTVGSGSTIAAGSVVVKDVPENCVFGGNPAKLIKNL